MDVNVRKLRRPLWILSLTLFAFYVVTGVIEVTVFGEMGTATFVLGVVTAASLCAAVIESRYGL